MTPKRTALPKATAEQIRLGDDRTRKANWKRWGPYLSERQWGTVREDYSEDGNAWAYFPHDHARSRAYRWGEDGLMGFCDREGRMLFAVALWNEKDPFLKERLFGLTNHEGNHGEDVKESYFYLDSTPTHSYVKSLYKYPQKRFPYEDLVAQNDRAGLQDREFDLEDSAGTSTSSRSTRRTRPTTSSSASRSPTAGPRRRGSTCCRRSGSGTAGAGARSTRPASRVPASRAGPTAPSSRTTCRSAT
jgi:hypothetical protein